PLFRTWAPTTSPTRLLPRLSSILAGSNTTAAPTGGGWVEQLYVAGRTSTWRVIARDNRIGGGGVTTDDMTLTVVNTGAAFAVTAPNSAVTWFAGQGHTVSWNVAGTTGGGINAASVKILLSTDGGTTFPHVLAASTSNDGSELVTLPAGLTSTTARVKIEAVGNVFFDLSNANFTIGNGTPPPGAIAGQAYEDRDADGAFGGGDLPLQNVVVYLDKNDNGVLDAGGPSPEPASTTNALGTYSFASVGAGTHKVRAQLPAGYVATAPVGGAASVTVSSGATATQNFGQFPTVYAGTGAADSYTLRLSQPAAAAHYTDDFNRAALAGGSNVYTTQVSAGDGAASITANDVLTLTNDASAAVPNAAGQVYVTTPTSAFAGFNPHLHANAAPIAWSFNVQQVRTDPGGLSGTSYGVAYVLGATNGTFVGTGAGNGYAVVIGNSGSVDPIRLVRFTGGLGGTLTGLASDAAQNATNRHWSVKVTFDPASDQWSLFTRDDGTGGFTNPLGGGTPLVQSGATVADSTYTGAASLLTHAGPYWAYSTSANQAAKFDNITLAPAAGGGGGGASRVEVLLGGVVTYSAPPGLASSLTFNTAGGDDSLVIDYANGNPIPAGGAFYDGGDGGDDALVINGSAAANHVKLSSAFAGPAAQNINLHDAATGARTVEGVTFNGGAGNDSLTVVTAPATGGAGGGATKLTFNGGTAPGETDALNLHAGDWAIGGDLGAATANAAISVSNSGTAVALGATQHLASLAIDGATVTLTADGSRLMNTGALAVTGSGTLDLQDNDLVVRDGGAVSVAGSTYNGVAGLIAAGRVLGSQTSSLAPAARAALAAATASEVLAIAPGDTATWQGETVSGSAVLIKHTYVGDADLNGKITGDDYFAVDSHVASLNPWGWWRGDFDHNARIDGDDYFLIDSNIARQGAAL
ncbi:MAG TPA: SdrD B-like domain-containing protein, partial [Tepidisphaeraceae bacterium]|nr:SdrD B-like domain-containing protein [Tepidisphaeraceae bacterium]